MSIVGYARVSSCSQNLDLQLEQLAQAGCEKIFAEKVTGTSRNERQALADCLDWVREGDTLVVTRLDRLARSGRDLHDIIAQLSAKQVGFRCVQQGAVDTTSSMGKLILGILGAVAEFETDTRAIIDGVSGRVFRSPGNPSRGSDRPSAFATSSSNSRCACSAIRNASIWRLV